MMKYILIYLFFLGSIKLSIAQSIYISTLDSIVHNISKLEKLKESDIQDSLYTITLLDLIKSTKEYSDHYYYTNLRELALREKDKEKRILMFKEISLYPFYRIQNNSISYYARDLYSDSILQLIMEYRGNIELLKSIEVYPAFRPLIYPSLKRAIEVAGGKWDKE